MREQTYILLSGAVEAGQRNEFAPVAYARQVLRATLAVITPPVGAPLVVELDVAGTPWPEQLSLPADQKRVTIVLANGGIGLSADTVLGAEIVTPSDALDVTVWIESETVAAPGADENWVVLTAAMLQSRIAAPEYAVFTGSAIQGGQADPVPQILADVTQLVRAVVRSGGRVALGPAGTVPASAKSAALAIAKFDIYARVVSFRQYLETLRHEKEAAEKYLALIARGDITPEAPAAAPAEEATPPRPRFAERARQWTRDQQEGL